MKFLSSLFKPRTPLRNHFRSKWKITRAVSVAHPTANKFVDQSLASIDGQEHPPLDLPHSPHEAVVRHEHSAISAEVGRRFTPKMAKKHSIVEREAGKIETYRNERQRQLQMFNERRQRDLEVLDSEKYNKVKAFDESIAELYEDFHEKDADLAAIRKEASIAKGRPRFSQWPYILLNLALVVMGVGEFAANFQMTSQILRENSLLAILFSAGFSLLLILLAHHLGHATAKLLTGRFAKIASILKAGIALTVVATALGLLRSMLALDGGLQGENAEMAQWAIVGIIAFLPTGAFFLAYFTYDPHQDLKKAYNRILPKVQAAKTALQNEEQERRDYVNTVPDREQEVITRYDEHINWVHKNFQSKEDRAFTKQARAKRSRAVIQAKKEGFENSLDHDAKAISLRYRSQALQKAKLDPKHLPTWAQQEPQPVFKQELPKPPKVNIETQKDNGARGMLLLLLPFFLLFLGSCDTGSVKKGHDLSCEILIDRTDSLLIENQLIQAEVLINYFEHISYPETRPTLNVALTELSHSAFAPTRRIRLHEKGRDNEYNNIDSLLVFKTKLHTELSRAYRPLVGEAERSRLYNGLCEALTRLHGSDAKHRVLFMHSDFLEYGAISFYHDHDLLTDNPRHLEQSFIDICPLPNLRGIKVHLLASATGELHERIIQARSFFKRMLEAKGAEVSISIDH